MMNRRTFLVSAAYASALPIACSQEKKELPSERFRVGVVGTNGQGKYNWGQLKGAGAEVVALCDVDTSKAVDAQKAFPQAKFYQDFRKMIDAKGLDGVLCATPDHTHFHVTYAALTAGLHAYCEKPLTHTVWEARVLNELAKKKKLATQMGTQIHAGDNYRRVVELIRAGTLGAVREVHVWVGKGWSGNGTRPKTEKVPDHLNWDLWLGGAPDTEYSSGYHPANWRRYWDFGGGTFADMACHHMDLPFWALNLRHPISVEATGPKPDPITAPEYVICKYEFPAREKLPPVTLTWYDGGKRPKQFENPNFPKWGDGCLFVGEKGSMLATYGSYLFVEKDLQSAKPDMSIPNSIGHHKEWIEAAKTGKPTTCNFDYSGTLTEAVLLGVVSYRSGKAIQWDAEKLQAKGLPELNSLIKKPYRKGWEISGS
jgi:predicted dehydrogenase